MHFCDLSGYDQFMIKKVLSAILFILPWTVCMGQERDTLLIMFWNLENFFDYIDGGEGESDKEFSSFGQRHWTKRRFMVKCNHVAKSIYWVSDIYGKIPDIVGLAEIENRNVLYRLLNDTALRKAGYAFVHYDGNDRRGIDVALLYRKSVFRKISHTRKVPISPEGDTLQTRDILHVEMQSLNSPHGSPSTDLIVNHHPSKFGGARQSQTRREAAMAALKNLTDSLVAVRGSQHRIIAMGDFNDNPESGPFEIMKGSLVNMAEDLHRKGQGTIRYEGRWDLIDMFLVSPDMQENVRMEIVKVPFLMTRDTKHAGEKPFRTYSGPKYIGGVSDHCPIILKIR